ncbi:MAG: flavin reductase [Spirochaetaceae bacterium 4572_59]|nr:MAG: flavin reductase [Spirochaetaceae bacterium 4572_59]
MKKVTWKPGNMIYPVPAVLVSCGSEESGYNLITVSWTGTVCTNPPLCYISLRPGRYSYEIIKESGEFVINLTNRKMARATDWCGVKSGRDFDKFKETGLTPLTANIVKAPLIEESPINIECRVIEIKQLGSHDMFLSEVLSVHADSRYMDPETGAFDMQSAELLASAHGKYCALTPPIGHFGYSIRKKKKKARWSDKPGKYGKSRKKSKS